MAREDGRSELDIPASVFLTLTLTSARTSSCFCSTSLALDAHRRSEALRLASFSHEKTS